MRLRPRQKIFVERSLAALDAHGNTLSVASTGFGKSVALSAVVGEVIGGGLQLFRDIGEGFVVVIGRHEVADHQ